MASASNEWTEFIATNNQYQQGGQDTMSQKYSIPIPNRAATHVPNVTNVWFSQLPDVESRFRKLREHLNNNIPHEHKTDKQEDDIEKRIDEIREKQNEIFRKQFKLLTKQEIINKKNSNSKNDDDKKENRNTSDIRLQQGKYQDISQTFEIEQSTTDELLKQLRVTAKKMKELNEIALGKHQLR